MDKSCTYSAHLRKGRLTQFSREKMSLIGLVESSGALSAAGLALSLKDLLIFHPVVISSSHECQRCSSLSGLAHILSSCKSTNRHSNFPFGLSRSHASPRKIRGGVKDNPWGVTWWPATVCDQLNRDFREAVFLSKRSMVAEPAGLHPLLDLFVSSRSC